MGFKSRGVLVITVLAFILFASVGLCAPIKPAHWPSYHKDSQHTGVNDPEFNILGDSIGMVFTFPRWDTKQTGGVIVDNTDGTNFAMAPATGEWKTPADWIGAPINYYNPGSAGPGFYWIETRSAATATARWYFPYDAKTLPAGLYTVEVRVPMLSNDPNNPAPGYKANSVAANYKVVTGQKSTPFTVNQQQGNQWIKLGDGPIYMDQGSYIELNNAAQDYSSGTIVCADAIRFVSVVGMEIYSSPAAGDAAVGDGNALIPAVWVGTVESSIASQATGLDNLGAMYCVRSYKGIGKDPSKSKYFNWSDTQVSGVGTAAWRYPRAGRYDERAITDANTLDRSPIEGPIGRITGEGGGVYSSPTLVTINGTTHVVFAGDDGQVYCVNADTGKLRWKGPGVTISEQDPDGAWNKVTGRYDAFGGTFLYTDCIPNTGQESKLTYTISGTSGTHSDPGLATSGKDGQYYAIYAWIPARYPGSDPADAYRTIDASYCITSDDAPDGAYVTIDERTVDTGDNTMPTTDADGNTHGIPVPTDPNAGKWVRLGDKFWNPSQVVLSNKSTQLSMPEDPKNPNQRRIVVADAIMVVPEELDLFGYASAVPDNPTNTTKIYIGNQNGRVYALDAKGMDGTGGPDHATHLSWVFPRVQTENPATQGSTDTQTGFGPIVSSPAVGDPTHIVVSSTDGKVYNIALDTTGVPSLYWSYDTADPYPGSSPKVTEMEPQTFSSSPAVSTADKVIYVPSTGGRMYALSFDCGKDSNGKDLTTPKVQWITPDPKITGSEPLAAFRYSTPVVTANTAGDHRVYCGCTDGSVYAFDATAGTLLNTDPTTDNYTTPDLFAPIWGSVAFDQNNMYVGTMGTGTGDDGGLYWFNRKLGTAQDLSGYAWQNPGYSNMGQLMSSPAVANDYVYVGSSMGRLFGFSSSAFGGQFVGGGEDGYLHPPIPRAKSSAGFSLYGNQVDIYSAAVWNETLQACQSLSPDQLAAGALGTVLAGAGADNAKLFVDSSFTGDQPDDGHKRAYPYNGDSTTYSGDRKIYFEWGESVYLIAYNLPPLEELDGGANAVTFRFNNSGVGRQAGGTIDSAAANYVFEYKSKEVDPTTGKPTGKDVKRCIAFAKLEIRTDRSNPPAPGCGWTCSLRVRRQVTTTTDADTGTTTTTRSTDPLVSIPLLSSGTVYMDPKTKARVNQEFGINNPLAIRDEGIQAVPGKASIPNPNGIQELGWPTAYDSSNGGWSTNRNGEDTVHINGNTYVDSKTNTWTYKMPKLYAGWARHGANSQIVHLGVMSRCAVGLNLIAGMPDVIDCFRIEAADAHWQGGNEPFKEYRLPWDVPPFSGGVYNFRSQKDYPDISRKQERFQKSPDATDPSECKNSLQPCIPYSKDPQNYDKALLRPDSVDAWVEVPLFQPANLSGPGYDASLTAYLDTDGDGVFDSGDIIAGRPSTYIEANRSFELSLDVAPDFHMVVETPKTIDLKGPDGSTAPHGLNLFTDQATASTTGWWKEFTVRNLGNVNLYNIKIPTEISQTGYQPWGLNLYSQDVSSNYPILGHNKLTDSDYLGNYSGIISSFDDWDPNWGYIGNDTKDGSRPIDVFKDANYGYTLSKARVGDVNGTILTIPDTRKCEIYPDITKAAIQAVDAKQKVKDTADPIMPSVSLRIPLTQPSGSYTQLIPVFADMGVNDGTLQVGSEPYCDPTFQMNVTVAEDRITGGTTSGAAPQIDKEGPQSVPLGDATPAAYRDPVTGQTHLVWSTNRFATLSGTSVNKNLPWYLDIATLPYNAVKNDGSDAYDWHAANRTLGSEQWWMPSTTPLPDFKWPSNSGDGSAGVATASSLPADLIQDSIKHSSPFIGLNEDIRDDKGVRAWLVWQGQAQVNDPVTHRIETENRIMYTLASSLFNPPSGGGSINVYSFGHDLTLMRMNPKTVSYNSETIASPTKEILWLIWHGGDAGRSSIYGNLNISKLATASTDDSNHDPHQWSGDIRFPTPACLSSVADPSPVHRIIEAHGGSTDVVEDKFIDMAYTGMSKYDSSSDIIFTRYMYSHDKLDPKVTAGQLPRIFGEELVRDPKLNVYTSEDLAWLRPPSEGCPDAEKQLRLKGRSTPYICGVKQEPYIHVWIPNYSNPNIDVPELPATNNVVPEIDRATGIYTYKYDAGSDLANTVGEMIVDYSAGIVRFTKPLPANAKVFADYTPQAMRLTRGPEQDSNPFMFIERTPMRNPQIPSTSSKGSPCPVSRMWLFWRKPTGNGVQASAIYYKTYRMSVTLPKPIDKSKLNNVRVDGASHPFEVSWDGTKLYFTDYDERYPGLKQNATQDMLNTPIHISYNPASDPNSTEDFEINTLSWQEELPETALPTRLNINEGQVCAFADPCSGTSTRIFVFWSSTRAGESDIYYETISPNFTGVLGK